MDGRLSLLARRPWRDVAVTAAIVALVCIVSYVLPVRWFASAGVVTRSTTRPDERPITPHNYHSAATGDQPKYLRLPTVSTQGFIQKVGVDQSRQIAVPSNIHLAGWFVETVTPGELGLSIIDGHLDGYSQDGIFARLAGLKAGDGFSVDLANGITRTFRVRRVRSLPSDQAAAELFSQDPGVTRQLNLITCGGNYDKGRGYDQRVVVTAELVSGT